MLLVEPPTHSLPPLPRPHLVPTAEQSAPCQRLTELRNLTKGPCYLDQVAVSYCSGHCPSSTNVMPEVSLEPGQSPGGVRGTVCLMGRQLIRARPGGQSSPRTGLRLLLGLATLGGVHVRPPPLLLWSHAAPSMLLGSLAGRQQRKAQRG